MKKYQNIRIVPLKKELILFSQKTPVLSLSLAPKLVLKILNDPPIQFDYTKSNNSYYKFKHIGDDNEIWISTSGTIDYSENGNSVNSRFTNENISKLLD